jgi:hypothetical protein
MSTLLLTEIKTSKKKLQDRYQSRSSSSLGRKRAKEQGFFLPSTFTRAAPVKQSVTARVT